MDRPHRLGYLVLVLPFVAISATLLFFDLKVRRERAAEKS